MIPRKNNRLCGNVILMTKSLSREKRGPACAGRAESEPEAKPLPAPPLEATVLTKTVEISRVDTPTNFALDVTGSLSLSFAINVSLTKSVSPTEDSRTAPRWGTQRRL